MNAINKINHLFNNYLPWIVLAVAVVAFLLPGIFTEAAKLTVPLLQLVMFCMGLTLTAGSFVQVFKQPWQVILVSLIQFIWMPLAGYLIGVIFNFPPEVAIGFILLGACPGGTASNLCIHSLSTHFDTILHRLLWVYHGRSGFLANVHLYH